MSKINSLRLGVVVTGLLLLAATGARADDTSNRLQIMELMDRYGVVHDFGTPEEYADLFTKDGEISVGSGPPIVKGREAVIAQARRDNQRFAGAPAADGTRSSIMRHIITNRIITRVGRNDAEGSSYVVTLINDKEAGPQILSFSRYEDRYRKEGGVWRIAHRSIITESGNPVLGRKLGFQ
jgi:SnoaL-like protein